MEHKPVEAWLESHAFDLIEPESERLIAWSLVAAFSVAVGCAVFFIYQ
jgi:hypothetical protein